MRKFLLAVALIATFAIASCGGNNKECEQKCDSTEVSVDTVKVAAPVVDTAAVKK